MRRRNRTARLLWRWLRLTMWTHRRRARQLEELRLALRLHERERESLERQIDAYRDFVQSFGWERRAIGAEAAVYAETLRRKQ